jgi:hypothetical protein
MFSRELYSRLASNPSYRLTNWVILAEKYRETTQFRAIDRLHRKRFIITLQQISPHGVLRGRCL